MTVSQFVGYQSGGDSNEVCRSRIYINIKVTVAYFVGYQSGGDSNEVCRSRISI